ncbi:unnamed protein product [Vitrella brassicaformis CCMP3155]|uniref:Uncharacterized protein n=1 Tax=Vitrella brassicaformis (strain CCMP3155) TaxID=1169540 RepID=A0A0G4EW96_VITBC|nr:unnamed protein product [Vitrella brassicaformis CCMP3155]|mmetsp:Transcript_38095/g.108768  ORF Transcript_38095/g.108768 Transcript_38095/m.108768 type:complete len:393 (+) Transcript_38095:129-1307(+)|eukprot:CEM02312.1 unnamed protein product [Vitrella brassicaformis CCMP3155]
MGSCSSSTGKAGPPWQPASINYSKPLPIDRPPVRPSTFHPLDARLYRRIAIEYCDLKSVLALRATNKTEGATIISLTALLDRLNGLLVAEDISGLIDVEQHESAMPGGMWLFDYVARATYLMEHRGQWRKWKTSIYLAKSSGLVARLPITLDPAAMQSNFPSRTDYHEMPPAIAQYASFGSRIGQGDGSMALIREEGLGEWYRIGNGEHRFRTVMRSDLPGRHLYRLTYDESDPVIRRDDDLFPSFSGYVIERILEQGMAPMVASATIMRSDSRYGSVRRLLAASIQGHCAVGHRIDGGNAFTASVAADGFGQHRFIVVSGDRWNDGFLAYVDVHVFSPRTGCLVRLFTNEGRVEGQEGRDGVPATVSKARSVLQAVGVDFDALGCGFRQVY